MEDDQYEDFFLEDEIENLPYSTLLHLEENAYQATQQDAASVQRQVLQPSRPSLNQRSTSNISNGTTLNRSNLQDPSRHLRPPLSLEDTNFQNLDAGVLDDGTGMDLVEEGNTVFHNRDSINDGREQMDHAPRLLHGASSLAYNEYDAVAEDDAAQPLNNDLYNPVDGLSQGFANDTVNADSYPPAEIEDMKEQIEQLSREREQALQELAAAKAAAESRAGENAIIRSNQAKLEKNHNQQLSVLRNAMGGESNKYKAEMEAILMESKRLTTENAFLKQDLKEETYKTKKLQQNLKNKVRNDDMPRTPSKNRTLPLRDGFDDDELMVSPSKSAGRMSRRGTPTTSSKRKRSVEDSPTIAALQLSQSFGHVADEMPEQGDSQAIEALPEKHKREDRNLRFMRSILNHRTFPRKVRDIEVFGSMSFPSDRDRKFLSIILEATTSQPSENYAIDYAKAIISLWSRALKEKFHEPVGLFMSIIKFIINLDLTGLAPFLIEDLVPVLQLSGYVNGVPRFVSSPVSHQNLGQVKQTAQKELDHLVNSTEALEILYLIVSGCQHDEDSRRRFWRCVGYDFILIMLNSYQQLNDIILILKTLSCSILPNTFGPIDEEVRQQKAHENYIIDRAANLLSELPSVDEGEKPYTTWEISTLRVEVMSFLIEIAFSSPDPTQSRIGKMLAAHPSALARVFRSMHDELDALYSNPPERDLHSALVNGLTRLVHGIITSFPGQIDIPAKLRAVPGAMQKHLVVLTRLAFSEGPLLEAGISDDTVEMAHEMLEDAVNPQEAEALLEVFRSRSED